MEFFFLTVSLTVTIIILAFTFTFSFKTKLKSHQKSNLPPGDFGWPFVGETLEFLYGKPNKFMNDRMNKYSPIIFKTKVLGEPTVVVCGPSGNKFLATNEEKLFTSWRPPSMQKLFRSSYQKVPSALTPREVEVQVLRAPGFLRPEALARYIEKMDINAQEHLKNYWEGKERVEVYPMIKLLTASLASQFFLGLQDTDRVLRLSKMMEGMSLGLHSMPLNFPGTVFYRAKKGADGIRTEIELLIKEKRAAMAKGIRMNDILSFMIVNNDPTGRFMPESEIADKVMGLLVAGFSTPTTAITFLMKRIGEWPEVYEKILAEQSEIEGSMKSGEALQWDDLQKMKYSWNVALEVMRLTPPFQGTFREALTDINYKGYTIPKGWKIYWTVSTTNKNPNYFPDPDRFNPTRFDEGNSIPPYTNVPFGGGPRICPGKEYARIVILVFLHNVVKKFRWEIFNPDEKIVGNMIPVPAHGLPIRLRSHAA